jgi:hypothetical protein
VPEMGQILEICEHFILKLNELSEVRDVVQLIVFLRMIFSNVTSKEELLKQCRYMGRIKPKVNFKSITLFSGNKCVSVNADGALAMTRKRVV